MARRRTAFAQRRIALGLTQERLADILDMDVSAIKRWERGTVTPHPNVRTSLAETLQVSLEDLAVLLEALDAETGIIQLSSGKEDRISEYKQCLLAATSEILVSGTSLLHITEDSLGILAQKLETCTVRMLIMDPDWIEHHAGLLTFLRNERARQRFRYEIDASIDRLQELHSTLPADRAGALAVRAYATVFPYIMTGCQAPEANDSRLVVEITDYIPSDRRPRFTLTPRGSEPVLYKLVVSKFDELWNSSFVREVL